MSEMRNGLEYAVYYTNAEPPIYRIGARISQTQPMHGGNVHWLEGIYDTKQAAQAALDAMLAEKDAS